MRGGAALLACVAALGLGAGASHAQDGSRADATDASQLSRPRGAPVTAASQISRATPLASGPGQAVDRTIPAAPEPSAASRATTGLQLTGERGRVDAGAQLVTSAPSAGPAPTTAQRMAGRDTTTERPQGPDRCDPRARDREARDGDASAGGLNVCARVIETRALDFPAPNPEPLSPEQRLLVTQRELNPMARDVSSATRRLAEGDVDESNAGLAVASMTLARPATMTDDEDEPAADTSVTDAIVAGVLAAVGQTPNP